MDSEPFIPAKIICWFSVRIRADPFESRALEKEMEVDLGRCEDVGFADVIRTGRSREETTNDAKRIAKKLGIKLNINYVPEFTVGSVVLDTRTGRCSLVTSPVEETQC